MLDPILCRLAESAESGHPSPNISALTTDGSLFVGPVVAGYVLAEDSEDALREHWIDQLSDGKRRRADDVTPEADRRTREALSALASESADSNVLTMAPATWTPQHGKFKVVLPVARVAIAQVAAWWVVGGTLIEQDKGGGTWVAGVAFPLGN
jgi:hypothetical protein